MVELEGGMHHYDTDSGEFSKSWTHLSVPKGAPGKQSVVTLAASDIYLLHLSSQVILAVYVDITMKAAKETEALTAEQHFRESIRIARTTRELLKRFAAAHRWLEMHKEDELDSGSHSPPMDTTVQTPIFTDEDVHENLAINKECFLMAIQDREVPSFELRSCCSGREGQSYRELTCLRFWIGLQCAPRCST